MPLYFNETTVLGFESVFRIPYSLPITYVWHINGKKLDRVSNYLAYNFGDGTYNVTSVALYTVPRCEPCKGTKSIYVIVEGIKRFYTAFVEI